MDMPVTPFSYEDGKMPKASPQRRDVECNRSGVWNRCDTRIYCNYRFLDKMRNALRVSIVVDLGRNEQRDLCLLRLQPRLSILNGCNFLSTVTPSMPKKSIFRNELDRECHRRL